MSVLRQILDSWFLGSEATFHNGSRVWLYAGFVAVVLIVIGISAWHTSV